MVGTIEGADRYVRPGHDVYYHEEYLGVPLPRVVLPALNEVHLEPVYRNLEEACYSSRTIFQSIRLLWKYLRHLVNGIVGAGISLLPITNRHLALRWSTLEYDDTLDN